MTLKPLPTFREQVSKTNANLLAGTSRSNTAWLCLLQLAAHILTIFRQSNFSQNFGITCKISRAIRVSSSAICSHLCRANPGPVNSRHCPYTTARECRRACMLGVWNLASAYRRRPRIQLGLRLKLHDRVAIRTAACFFWSCQELHAGSKFLE